MSVNNEVCRFCGKKIKNEVIWIKLPVDRCFSPACHGCRDNQVRLRSNISLGLKQKLQWNVSNWILDNQKWLKSQEKPAVMPVVVEAVKERKGLDLFPKEECE